METHFEILFPLFLSVKQKKKTSAVGQTVWKPSPPLKQLKGAFTQALFSAEKVLEQTVEKRKLLSFIYWNGLAKTFFNTEKCLV